MSIRALTLLTAVWFCCGCTTTHLPHADAEADPVFEYLHENLGVEKDSPFVLKRTIELEAVLPSAFQVDIRDQTPAYTLVLIETANGAVASLINKTLTRDWKEAVDATLETAKTTVDDPSLLAGDLTKLLVDPNPRYGKVVSKLSDIPVDIKMSDRLRDLERRGLDSEQIRTTLLGPLSDPSQLHAPLFVERDGQVYLEYFTWGYFGGEVLRWRICLTETTSLSSVEAIASLVGSYDFYM